MDGRRTLHVALRAIFWKAKRECAKNILRGTRSREGTLIRMTVNGDFAEKVSQILFFKAVKKIHVNGHFIHLILDIYEAKCEFQLNAAL